MVYCRHLPKEEIAVGNHKFDRRNLSGLAFKRSTIVTTLFYDIRKDSYPQKFHEEQMQVDRDRQM